MASFNIATFLLLLASAAAFGAAAGAEITTHLHFFFHDIVTPRQNATAVRVADGPSPTARPPEEISFGDIYVLDDLLTEGLDAASSAVVGRAQGYYMVASLQMDPPYLALLMSVNLVFTAGKYSGSTLTVLGRDAMFDEVREYPVVGGSGAFRMARGYALMKTDQFDMATGNAILEWDIHVIHNEWIGAGCP
ncbi:dirigent protein 21-like [Canna indica]|uniref:Dirigent protein n=1 Tax=Canna indica TaxID=4628 RepID=A0AAQ3K5F1_9LILI|nr:dirigent protein 21-like [Canna indica]